MLKHSSLINRLIRQENQIDLGKPTRPFIENAVANAQPDEARTWLDYYLTEQQSVLNIYCVWNWYMVQYYLEHKTGATLQEVIEKSMAPWVGATAGLSENPLATVSVYGRDVALSIDGLEWEVILNEGEKRYDITLGTRANHDKRHTAWRAEIDATIAANDVDGVNRLLDDRLPQAWLVHDIHADWSWALLSLFMREWGEEILEEVLRVTEEPWVSVRYASLTDMSQEEAFQLTIEGMRGHFTGPERAGQIQVDDEPDRWVMSFDACGSGGRMRRGDAIVGSGSRLEAPYHFLNVEGAYDFTWNQPGVCAYCAHCAVVNQILPIEGLGFPMRLVEYPKDANDPCRWIIYKDKDAFPDQAFTDVGKNLPA